MPPYLRLSNFRIKRPRAVTEKSTLDDPEIGTIEVHRSPRARRISITVRPPAKVRLTMPFGIEWGDARRFLDSKREWIKQAVEKQEAKHPPQIISMPYSTRTRALSLIPADTDKITVRLTGENITVTYPLEMNYASPQVQQYIKKGVEEAWRLEAKSMLPDRTAELAQRHGFRYRSVSVRNTVSKWGSCMPANDISLSLHLMRLPDHLIDYIIIHELCHTVHKNHGAEFHALLTKCTAGAHPAMRKELHKYHTRW